MMPAMWMDLLEAVCPGGQMSLFCPSSIPSKCIINIQMENGNRLQQSTGWTQRTLAETQTWPLAVLSEGTVPLTVGLFQRTNTTAWTMGSHADHKWGREGSGYVERHLVHLKESKANFTAFHISADKVLAPQAFRGLCPGLGMSPSNQPFSRSSRLDA